MCANHDSLASTPSRRGFLFTLGLALSGLAAALAGIPIVGYIFGPVRGRGGQAWIWLGSVAPIPEAQRRPAPYANPSREASDEPRPNVNRWARQLGGGQ